MNIIILKILLSIISGIILGLYFKNIAFFIYFIIIILYLIFYKKNKKTLDIIIIVFSIIIFYFVKISDNKYINLYNENIDISGIGEVISFAEEKDYTNKFIIKIREIDGDLKYKNTKLILYLDKNINLQYGDIIYFSNSNFERVSGERNDKGFNYERYLRQSKIYGILKLNKFEIIDQKRGIKYKFFKFKNDLKNILYENFNDKNAGFLSGILLRR